jgi:hypothetical protein
MWTMSVGAVNTKPPIRLELPTIERHFIVMGGPTLPQLEMQRAVPRSCGGTARRRTVVRVERDYALAGPSPEPRNSPERSTMVEGNSGLVGTRTTCSWRPEDWPATCTFCTMLTHSPKLVPFEPYEPPHHAGMGSGFGLSTRANVGIASAAARAKIHIRYTSSSCRGFTSKRDSLSPTGQGKTGAIEHNVTKTNTPHWIGSVE